MFSFLVSQTKQSSWETYSEPIQTPIMKCFFCAKRLWPGLILWYSVCRKSIKLMKTVLAPSCSSYHYFTNSFNTKSNLRFCASSNPALGGSEICDGENLWQWFRQEIRPKVYRRSTIPRKQFKSNKYFAWNITLTLYCKRPKLAQNLNLLKGHWICNI